MQSLRQLGDGEIVGILHAPRGEVIDFDNPEGRRRIRERKLLADLLAIGVKPFAREPVEHYMRTKEQLPSLLTDIGVWLDDEDHYGITYVATALIGIAATVAVGVLAFGIGEALAILGLGVLGLVLGLAGAYGLTQLGYFLRMRYYGSHWTVEALATTARKVPRRVRRLGDRIARDIPNTELVVHGFMLDPFLAVRHAEDPEIEYFVAVWDEGGFRTTD